MGTSVEHRRAIKRKSYHSYGQMVRRLDDWMERQRKRIRLSLEPSNEWREDNGLSYHRVFSEPYEPEWGGGRNDGMTRKQKVAETEYEYRR